METIIAQSPYGLSQAEYSAASKALSRVMGGYVDSPAVTPDGQLIPNVHDQWWARIVAQGRILFRVEEGYGDKAYRMTIAAVSHPTLPPGEVYAMVHTPLTYIRVYKCAEADARICLGDMGAYNL